MLRLVLLIQLLYGVHCACDNSTTPRPAQHGDSTSARFPVFPFRTAASVLDSTLQGHVRVVERGVSMARATPATLKMTATTLTAKDLLGSSDENESDPPLSKAENGRIPILTAALTTEKSPLRSGGPNLTTTSTGSILALLKSRDAAAKTFSPEAGPVPTLSLLKSRDATASSPEAGSVPTPALVKSRDPTVSSPEAGPLPAARSIEFSTEVNLPVSDQPDPPVFSGSRFQALKSGYKRARYKATSRPTTTILDDSEDPTVPTFPATSGRPTTISGGLVPILTPGTRFSALDEDDYDDEESLLLPSSSTSATIRSGRTKPIRRLVVGRAPSPVKSRAQPQEVEDDDDIVRDFLFTDIHCIRTPSSEHFSLKIHLRPGQSPPYLRDRPSDPLSSPTCSMSTSSSTLELNLRDLAACGVQRCASEQLCLTLVFPRLSTLALAEDHVTTVKCTPQPASTSRQQTVSFQGDSMMDRRPTSVVEGGGAKFAAEVGIFRRDPDTGLHTRRVNSGGSVRLGEPLQLRSVVRGGDGWTHSRLADVKVWRMRDGYKRDAELDPTDASEVMSLVDGKGCRNREYALVAETDPVRDPRNSLVHHFGFRAFLFRGQRASEPLILTARVMACREGELCSRTGCGGEEDEEPVRRRRRRAAPNDSVHDWSTQMALRVVGLDEPLESRALASTPGDCLGKVMTSLFGGALAMLVCCALGLGAVVVGRKRRGAGEQQFEYRRGEQSQRGQKPLPPIPRQSRAPSRAVGTIPRRPDNNQQVERPDSNQQSGEEYECIPGDTADPGVYVVYCCRSRSAPPSPRSLDDLPPEVRRTVRSVKARSGRRRGRALGDSLRVEETSSSSSTDDSAYSSSTTHDDNVTHLVTRGGGGSTRILIMPETKV